MSETRNLPARLLLAVSLLQGICLFTLYRSEDDGFWPSEAPMWSYPLWTLSVFVPLLLLLTLTRQNVAATLKYVAGFALLIALLAAYTGSQAEPFDEFPLHSLTFAFMATMAIASFKALMYLQQRANGVALSYPVLFTNSWRNFLVGVLAALFTLIFWLILMLWGQLFKVIGIEFFMELFTEDWFAIPVLTVAFGMGVILFRRLTRVIDNITQLLHWLIKLLLPLVVAVALVFLAALPVTGLAPLWDTGSGTALLLWLLALTLFFVNAVYQDGREADPYPAFLHRAIYLGLCATPIVAALALYGLVLRLQQYGWTVERCWGFVTWLILALFSVGYVLGIVRRRDEWTVDLARVNTGMGLVVLAVMVLANSPLLDFRKISLGSQLARVETGAIELEDFDFWYARTHLARPGYLAMEAMKADIGDSDPDLLAAIANPARQLNVLSATDIDAAWERMIYRPEPFTVPADLRRLVEAHFANYESAERLLVRTDLDEDGAEEYVLLLMTTGSSGGIVNAQLFHRDDGGWNSSYLYHSYNRSDDFREQLLDGEITLRAPKYKNIDIGGIVLRPQRYD